MGFLEEFRETLRVVVRAVLDRNGKVAPHDKTTVAVFLEKKEAGRPLYIGESFGWCFLEEIEPAAARNGEAEISHEFFMVLLADAEKIKNVLVQVIEEFHFGRFLVEEDLGTTAERFTIADVLWDEGNNLPGNAVLAAQIC